MKDPAVNRFRKTGFNPKIILRQVPDETAEEFDQRVNAEHAIFGTATFYPYVHVSELGDPSDFSPLP